MSLLNFRIFHNEGRAHPFVCRKDCFLMRYAKKIRAKKVSNRVCDVAFRLILFKLYYFFTMPFCNISTIFLMVEAFTKEN